MISFNPRIEFSLVRLIKKIKYMESTRVGTSAGVPILLSPGNTSLIVLPKRDKME